MGLLLWEKHSEVKEHIPPRFIPPTVWLRSTVRDFTFSTSFVTKYHNSRSQSFLYEAFGFYSGPVFMWQCTGVTAKLLEHFASQTAVGAGPKTNTARLQHSKLPSYEECPALRLPQLASHWERECKLLYGAEHTFLKVPYTTLETTSALSKSWSIPCCSCFFFFLSFCCIKQRPFFSVEFNNTSARLGQVESRALSAGHFVVQVMYKEN